MAIPQLDLEALKGGTRAFPDGQTGRDWDPNQLRYLPGQPRGAEEFGNILGGDNQTLAGAERWGLLPLPGGSHALEELYFWFCRDWRGGGRWVCTRWHTDTATVPAEAAGPRETVPSHRGGLVLLHCRDPGTDPREPLCSPRGLQGVTPPCSRQPGWGHPSSVPDIGVGYPRSQPGPGGTSLPQGR